MGLAEPGLLSAALTPYCHVNGIALIFAHRAEEEGGGGKFGNEEYMFELVIVQNSNNLI